MNESFLVKLAIIVSVLGITLLYFISGNIEVNDTTIQKITNEEITGSVQIKGQVKEITKSDKVTFLVINQESEIKAIAFDKLEVVQGDYVEITARVSDDSDEKELIVERLKVLN